MPEIIFPSDLEKHAVEILQSFAWLLDVTSRERPKSAPYLRLKIVKSGTLRALWNSSWLQNMKKFEGGTLWGLEKISQKSVKNKIFEQCHSAEKCKRGDSLGFFDIHCVAKYRNKWRGDPLVPSKKFQKKSHTAEKKSGAMGESLVWFRNSRRVLFFSFRFWRAFEVRSCWDLTMLNKWTKKWTLRV